MKKTTLILFILAVIYLINGICSINALSVTADEGSHLSYGIRLLKGEPARVNPEKDNSKMPISVINTIPRAVEQFFSGNTHKTDNGIRDTVNGRYITLFFSLLIIWLIFSWSRQLYGDHAGLFSAFLYVFCPNSLSNAVLVTTDTYSAFFLLATLYFLWRYSRSGSRKDLVSFALLLACSQLAKQSLFHLYVLLPLLMVIHTVVLKKRIIVKRLLLNLLIIITISWFVINAGFLFYGMDLKMGDYHFMSDLFRGLQSALPSGLPVPLSSAFVEGLDQAKFYDQLGGGYPNSSFGNVTILGHSSTGGSFWYYYLVSFFFKTPITFLLLFAWSGYLLLTRMKRTEFMRNEFFLIAPVLYFLMLMSFFYKTQCGIRQFIFVYPLLFIACGVIIRYFTAREHFGILTILSVFLVFSVSRYVNNYYAYTNEFIGNKAHAWQYVGASNLNIGQSKKMLARYLEHHPDVQMAPEEPRPGKFVILIDRYLDIWNTGRYAWLRKLKPEGEVHHSYLLFYVQPKDILP